MSLTDELGFGFGKRLPIFLQTEAPECGLACVAMVASYHGYNCSVMGLRRRFPTSMRGATLAALIHVAGELGLATRALKLEMEHLQKLQCPCILHWNFNHFVVLKSVGSKKITIHDPSSGVRVLQWSEFSKSFTGVALEFWPAASFAPQRKSPSLRLRSLLGRTTGLLASYSQILMLALSLEVFALVAPFFLQWVIDNVITSADRDLLSMLTIGFFSLMLMQQAITAARSWLLLYLSTTLSLQWRANVFSHLIRLPVQYFEKRHLGDLVSRFGATEEIQRGLTTSLVEALLDGLMAFITLGLMFMFSPTLSAIATGAMILYCLGRITWYRPLRQATEEQIIHASRQQSHFLETLRGVKAIKIFQRQEQRRANWLSLVVDEINAGLTAQKLNLLFRALNGLLFGAQNILIIWLGAKQVLDGLFSVGVLMAFIAYKNHFEIRVSSLIDKYFELKMLRLQADRLADIVLAEPEPTNQTPLFDHAELKPSLSINGLCYRYGPQEPNVLDGVSFDLEAGECVAIVGPSGCGKSTLLSVLLGVLPADKGEVRIGGIPIEQLGVDAIRHMVGTVMQDDVLFAGSISENISFFDPAADASWIAECAEIAAIAKEITAMPMGYNTLVGDMGTVVSGGQKQRILLARALYKRPRILFLDEATSHLDIENEQQVNRAIKSLNITRVIVAHRPETIASATRVIELLNGRVAKDLHTPDAKQITARKKVLDQNA